MSKLESFTFSFANQVLLGLTVTLFINIDIVNTKFYNFTLTERFVDAI